MYNWIQTTFNVSGGVTQAIAVILALAVVLLLFSLFVFILRRLMGGQASPNRNRQPRIAVMDSATIDTRRRLVLIRRDNIEHLLLVGGPSDVVVEQSIVRNMPLTQQRQGQSAAGGLAGPTPVKAPMAPGPEIPISPDDLAAQQETAPPPAVQARAQTAPDKTVPSAPVPPAAPPPPAAAQPVREATRSEPVAARPVSAPVSAPVPAPPAPAVAAQPVKPPETESGSRTETGRGLNRAADLLRAATQNGFSRTPAKAPAPETRSGGTALPEKSSRAEVGPAVSPAASGANTADTPKDSKTGSPLKSLARPFSPRDRPSYGGHSISPPASGPAARAKTALLKPLEEASQPTKVEPFMVTASVQEAALATDVGDIPQGEAARDEHLAPQAGSPTPPMSQTQSSIGTPVDDAAGETGANANQPETSAVSASPPSTPEAAPDAYREPSVSGPATGTIGASEMDEDPAPATKPEIALEMSDLLEDEDPAPAQLGTTAAETAPAAEPAEEDALEPEDMSSGGDGEKEEKTAEAADTVPAEVKKPAEPVRAAPRPTAGLGDKNPIEEEMAKILDELGGQPN